MKNGPTQNGAGNPIPDWVPHDQRALIDGLIVLLLLSIGAGSENRTRDIQLGKLSFYH